MRASSAGEPPRMKGDLIMQPTPLAPDLFWSLPYKRIVAGTIEQSRLRDAWFQRGPAAALKQRLREYRREWRRKRRAAKAGAPGRRPEHWYMVAEILARHPSQPLPALREWAQTEYPHEFSAEHDTPYDSTLFRWIKRARTDYGAELEEAAP